MQELRYGLDSRVHLDISSDTLLADWAAPRGTPLDDPAAAVAAAVMEPLDFPPLSRSFLPGDRIVLALDEGVPQQAAVIGGVMQTLMEAGMAPSDLTILRATPEPSLNSLLPAELLDGVQLFDHDPADQSQLCFLAVAKDDTPIYLNRALCEADVVLPVGAMRIDSGWGYWGVHGGLFPAFSDQATRRRFHDRSHTSSTRERDRKRLQAEAAEVAWLLGTQFTLQIIPGPGDSILHVLAGDAHTVVKQGQRLCEAAWLCEVPRRASLVVASLEGGPETQTWSNVARAVFNTSQVVADDGAIVLCTNLSGDPGPFLKHLAALDDHQRHSTKLRNDRTPEAEAARLLMAAKERCRVFLLSDLDSDFVEDLGLGHVSEPEQVNRLSRQFDSCILVGNAQHTVLTTREEE